MDAGEGQEAEEQAVYVMLELQGMAAVPPPGSRLNLKSMETSEPVLELPDGTVLVGRFEETVGTQLIFGDEVMTDGSHQVQLVCHTDKRIVFTKLQPQPPAVGWAQQQTETPQMPQEAS